MNVKRKSIFVYPKLYEVERLNLFILLKLLGIDYRLLLVPYHSLHPWQPVFIFIVKTHNSFNFGFNFRSIFQDTELLIKDLQYLCSLHQAEKQALLIANSQVTAGSKKRIESNHNIIIKQVS